MPLLNMVRQWITISRSTHCWQIPLLGRLNIFGTTDDSDLHGLKKRRALLGQAKLALCCQIPSQASLHGILKSIAHYAAQMALRLRLAQRSLGKNTGLRLVSKRGCVVKKASASPLVSIFSTTNPAFAQRINHRVFYLPI